VLGELDTIAVDPAYWRRGIGRALMDTAVDALRAEGYRRVILWTPARYPQGHAFYEQTGWRRTGATRSEGRHLAFERDLVA
jgi:GNAT superfamily N-acetyltransferase